MAGYAISKIEVIAVFFDDCGVIGDRYKRTLRYYLFFKLTNYSFDMILQPNEAHSHQAIPVRQYLDRKLSNGWMGRGAPIPWSAQYLGMTHVISFRGVF